MGRTWAWRALGVGVVLTLTGCQGGSSPAATGGASGQKPPPSVASAQPAVTFSPAAGASDVRMDQPVTVSADRGTLTSVQVTSAKGADVAGALDAAKKQWHSTGRLTANMRYTVTAVTSSGTAPADTETATFSTLKPAALTRLTLNAGDGQTVGVGLPIVLRFSTAVKNRDAAVKALTVTTTPQVEGSWRWMPDNQIWWRPREYWPSGTKVHVQADIGTVELGPGAWGARTYTSDFTIGPKVISTVDVNKHTLTFRQDGQPVRVLPVTTGRSTPDGKLLSRNGTKVIMEKGESVRMVGTDPQDSYSQIEHWAMRLTNSGEYLHARPESGSALGTANVSHGCTGLSNQDAKWLYDHSTVGDVVVYVNSKRPLAPDNGWGAWQLSYAQWTANSNA